MPDLFDRDVERRLRRLEAASVAYVAVDPVAPVAGSLWIRSDNGALSWRVNGTTISAAGTRMGGVLVAADQTGITTIVDLTGFAVTFNAVAGRTYRVEYTFGASQVTTAGAQTFRLSDGAADLGIIDSSNVTVNPAGASKMVAGFREVSGLTAGSHTLKLRGTTSAGTLTIPSSATVNGRFAVYDVGV